MKGPRHIETQHRQISLFGGIPDRMLTPFPVPWPISAALEYYVACSVAGAAHVRERKDSLIVFARSRTVRRALCPAA